MAKAKPISIEDLLRELAPVVDAEIANVIPPKLSKTSIEWLFGKPRYEYDLPSIDKALFEPTRDFLGRGGKRWRPVLLMLAYEAASGRSGLEIKRYAPIVELIHNGTLVADDIEDDSLLRRGKPTLRRAYGVDIAVNLSSALYFMPLALLYNDAKLAGETKGRLYDIVVKELLTCHAGQGMDIYWHRGGRDDVTEPEYLQMCAYKTGVLPRLAMKMGAILGGASDKQIEALGRFGEAIGVGFQIQDDILNVTESELAKGKGLGDDIHEGKRTLMVLHALSRATPADRKRLLDILHAQTNDQKLINEAIALFKKYGAIEYARGKAKAIVQSALRDLEATLPENAATEKLRAFARYLVERDV